MSRISRSRGFTLIELLVALVILALLSVAAYRGLNAVIQMRERVTEETRKWQQLSLFFSRMEQDIALAIRRPVRDQGGGILPEWVGHEVVVGEDDAELIFTRAGVAGQGSALQVPQRIAYRFEQGAVVMLRWPNLDQGGGVRPVRYPLLENVREFRLRYLASTNSWFLHWPPGKVNSGLPLAAEVTVTLSSGEKVTRVFGLP